VDAPETSATLDGPQAAGAGTRGGLGVGFPWPQSAALVSGYRMPKRPGSQRVMLGI